MNKRGIEVQTLIQLAIVAVVLFVMFLGAYPLFSSKLHAAEEKGTCEWAVLLAAVRKAGSLGIAEGVPEGCHAKTKTITVNDLAKKTTFARNRIKAFSKPPYLDKQGKSTAPSFQNDDSKTMNLFALDNIIADEMVECWEKVFKGRMPLFDEWWRLYNCKKDGKSEPCSKIEDFARFAFPVYGVFQVVSGGTASMRPPTNCVICAHITFDPKVREAIGAATVTTLNEWMGNNPVSRTEKSYLEYIQEGQASAGALFKLKENMFDLSDEGIAIVYERINAQQLTDLSKKLELNLNIGGVSEDINVLKLTPYRQENLVAPQGDCTFILD